MQNRRAFLFLVLSIALGVSAAFTAQRWLEQQRSQPLPGQATTQPVSVLRGSLEVGQALRGRNLATVDWPIDYVPQGAHADPAELEGRVLRRPLAAGEPVLESALLPEGSRAGLISVIDPAHRAVSVKVDPVVGVAGFVAPGTHVDVLVTILSEGKTVTKAILQDLQVLAIDQKLEEATEGQPELVQVVTLETSPREAEKLTFAAHNGRLQLALRNPTDREIVDTHSISVADVLSDYRPPEPQKVVARPAPRRAPGPAVEVIKGSQVSVQNF